ncbi:MAG: POTRA domain-containing protein [Flavobacteriales bacterium]
MRFVKAFICFTVSLTPLFLLAQSERNFVLSEIALRGNKVTKPRIIHRELLFRQGDTLSLARFNQLADTSRNNLMNTALFNFVEYGLEFNEDSTSATAYLKFTERWYTWPSVVFELADRNFNAWWADRDWRRVSYGLFLSRYNFRGRKESLHLRLRSGFADQVALLYNIPYINKAQTIGLGFRYYYTANNQLAPRTWNDNLQFMRIPGEKVRFYTTVGGTLNYRKGYFITHSFSVDYNDVTVADTVLKLNPNYLHREQRQNGFFRLDYFFRYDKRNFRPYPLSGWYFDFDINQKGLGYFDPWQPSMLSVSSSYRRYEKLAERFFAAAMLKMKVSNRAFQPYIIQSGLGYWDYVRGYELFVADGQHFGLFKSYVRYELLKPHVTKLKFIPSEKFNTIPYAIYLNLFFDAGYARNTQFNPGNTLPNQTLYGYGAGVDLVTYYDQVFRLEATINKHGIRGFYFHMTNPF